jgi:hypothetical protein
MSVAWYIVLERKIAGFDHEVNGKAIGRAGKVLEALAKEESVKPLMDFFSAPPQELAGFAEDHGMDLKEKAIKLPAEKWFPAEEGLKTVSVLARAVENRKIDQADDILDDLVGFRKVLEAARTNGVGWHLAVDF